MLPVLNAHCIGLLHRNAAARPWLLWSPRHTAHGSNSLKPTVGQRRDVPHSAVSSCKIVLTLGVGWD
jgi:hypothetical protein